MADVDFDGYEHGYMPEPGHGRLGRVVNLAGAAVSVALVLGLGWWGYKLAMRDVHGVPVFRAVSDPLRIAPADPGGTQASHQGLSVNAVAAAGTAAPLPDAVALAPAAPELLADDPAGLADLAMEAVPATAPAAGQPESAEALIAPEAMAEAAPMEAAPSADVDAALAEALGTEALAPEGEVAADPLAADPLASETLAAPEVTAPAVRPRARPASLAAAAPAADAAPAPAEAIAAAPAETAASAVAAGTRLVQLGAFDTEDDARREWSNLQGRFADLMASKSLVIQAAESGGRTFFRLRALGFADEAEARNFCTALLSGNATCIPVTQR